MGFIYFISTVILSLSFLVVRIYSQTTCSTDGDCDATRFTFCRERVCKCATDDEIFIISSQTCFLFAGGTCIPPRFPNSSLVDPPPQKCIHNSQCFSNGGISESCICDFDLERNNLGYCFTKFGKICSRNDVDLCDPYKFFKCGLDLLCGCSHPATMLYDDVEQVCKLLVGTTCERSTDSTPSCIENAECDPDTNICMCKDGFYPTPDLKHCQESNKSLSHGEPCDPSSGKDDCDTKKYLQCSLSSETCECSSSPNRIPWYDPNIDICSLKSGSTCSSSLGEQKCEINAECLNIGGIEKCGCKKHFVPNKNDLCFLSRGSNCAKNDLREFCDPGRHLECGIGGLCVCQHPLSTNYDLVQDTCLLLAGSSCIPIEINPLSQACVENANCIKNKCTCNPGYKTELDGSCKRSTGFHGQHCEINADCNNDKFLICHSVNKVCICGDNIPDVQTWYDPNTDNCYRKSTSLCSLSPGQQKCEVNAECLRVEDVVKCVCKKKFVPNILGLCFLPHGESCQKLSLKESCDSEKYLQCGTEGRCECKNADTNIYDLELTTCVHLAGTRCTSLEIDSKAQKCTPNASCSKQKCVCDTGFFHSLDGRCKPFTGSHGQACGVDEDCDEAKFLGCSAPVGGICICKDEGQTTWYDNQTKSCYLLTGAECSTKISGQKCIVNSQCLGQKVNNESVWNCVCNERLEPNEMLHCYLPYGKECAIRKSDPDLCDPLGFLNCGLNGVCTCRRGNESWFNPIIKACQLLVDSKCSTAAQDCVDHAECVDGLCKCNYGAISDLSKKCALQYGSLCLLDPLSPDLCDKSKGLECGTRGLCACANKDNTVYHKTLNRCFLRANSECPIQSEIRKCSPNSNCIADGGVHKCVCHEGLVPNDLGLCFLDYNSLCDRKHDICDPHGYLTCSLDKKCKCADEETQFFEPREKKCQLLAGVECTSSTHFLTQECVYNASCNRNSRGGYSCQCNSVFTQNYNGFCTLPFGAECVESQDECDHTIGLSCTGQNYGSKNVVYRCACAQGKDSFYDTRSKSCYLLAGSTCDPFDLNSTKCIPNSHCNQFTHTCECTGLLEMNPEKHCFLPHGRTCNVENDLCDQATHLYCRTDPYSEVSTCTCDKVDATWYDSVSKTCRLRAQVPCSTENMAQPCVENALCQINSGGSPMECICKDNLSANKNGRCFLKKGQNCEGPKSNLCDPDTFLNCHTSSRECQCEFTNTIYSEETQDCRRIPGGSCFQSIFEPECIKNSVCNVKNKICTCVSGYENSFLGSCLLSYNEPCGNGMEMCNHGNHLECIRNSCSCAVGFHPTSTLDSEEKTVKCLPGYKIPCSLDLPCHKESNLICLPEQGFCDCSSREDQIFDFENGKCVGLLGSECNLNTSINLNLNCFKNMECRVSKRLRDNYGKCECKDGFKPNDLEKTCSSGVSSLDFSFASLFLILLVYCKSIQPFV